MLRLIYTFVFLTLITNVFSQNNIVNRVIFIGDAGEINFKQETIIPLASELIIKDKTTVLYLGDNIYPRGMGLPGSIEEKETEEILRSQFEPMRAKGAPVYFIPGNHDWDKMGKDGLKKIKAQGNFLARQNDPLLKLIPANGCPDPVEISLSDSLVMIVYDSEWWLFPHKKTDLESECECNSNQEVLEKIEELFYKNQNKTILLTSHHPFQSYGVHGGHFSLKDHLFPLTHINKKLYIPLPGLGSMYPLLRTTVFLNPEDMPHPKYKNLKKSVSSIFEGFPNVLYIAGHEHGLQFIKTKDYYQIVSGSGSKSSFIKNSKKLLYKNSTQGFVTVDMLDNRSTEITYYTYDDHNIKIDYTYNIPYVHENIYADELVSTDGDSVIIRANEKYDEVRKFHRSLFGENYRKEWAAPTRVPVLRISEIQGGLSPLKRGGGMQTVSLRLADSSGNQWVLRSVNKRAESLLPTILHQTFATDFVDDAVSAQHPYSALMVPPIANAVKVPHTNPIIGFIATDTALKVHNLNMAGTLALLERREPLGKSDNTPKMLAKVYNDNNDTFDAKTFLRSRMLDLLIGDWDRHEDQYRWVDELPGKGKDYKVVPRDRDQVIRKMEGVLPYLISRSWAVPTIQGFQGKIPAVNYSILKSNFLNAHPNMQFSLKEWNELSKEFANNVTDSVLKESVNKLPQSSYSIRGEQILAELKERRDSLPSEMEKHYRFINEIVDIRLTNKNEWVSIEDDINNGMKVTVQTIDKEGVLKKTLMDKTYDPDITKEIRIYLGNGADSVYINALQSPIQLRIIGGDGNKNYSVEETQKKVKIYDLGNSTISQRNNVQLKLSSDSSNVDFVPVNLYNVTLPLITTGYDPDDGLILGGGFRYIGQKGFRKTPYTHMQQLMISGSLSTESLKINYKGQWREAIGKADIVVEADILAPNNTQNFFGLGNNSKYDKKNHNIRYYRARFNLFDLNSSLQWKNLFNTFKIGPSLQYYSYNESKNRGRFIENSGAVKSYDSLTVAEDKIFAGFQVHFLRDNRNSKLLPSSGAHFTAQLKGYAGLNKYSKSFAQLNTEFSFYKNFANEAIILANRIGGATTLGKTAFYQSHFLGGHGNLLGLRKYRYAGAHMLYNNLETRIKLAQVGSYILPGQLGLVGFYDVGKTWSKGYNSSDIHQGVGGGMYYAPAQMLVVQALAGHSEENWNVYLHLGFRF